MSVRTGRELQLKVVGLHQLSPLPPFLLVLHLRRQGGDICCGDLTIEGNQLGLVITNVLSPGLEESQNLPQDPLPSQNPPALVLGHT